MSFLHKLMYKLSGWLHCRIIKGNKDEPYLERYHIARLGSFTFYLHRFTASDPDRGVHDHPWGWAMSFLLVGGYNEERLVERDGQKEIIVRKIRPLTFNTIRADDFHRVVLDQGRPAWSLFIHGKRIKGWGFLKLQSFHGEEGFTPHDVDGGHRFANWYKTAPRGRDLPRQPVDMITPRDVRMAAQER